MTDINKMREKFEAWVLDNWPEQSLARFTTGEYQGYTVEHCWLGWQASRAAVVVELPGKPCYRGYAAYDDAMADAAKAIEAHGLKVAP